MVNLRPEQVAKVFGGRWSERRRRSYGRFGKWTFWAEGRSRDRRSYGFGVDVFRRRRRSFSFSS
jgi:hypothetical protein